MIICHECDIEVTKNRFKCILCDKYAHERCAFYSNRINEFDQYYCIDHARYFVVGERRKIRVNATRAENPRGDDEEDQSQWGQSDSEENEEEEVSEEESESDVNNSRSRSQEPSNSEQLSRSQLRDDENSEHEISEQEEEEQSLHSLTHSQSRSRSRSVNAQLPQFSPLRLSASRSRSQNNDSQRRASTPRVSLNSRENIRNPIRNSQSVSRNAMPPQNINSQNQNSNRPRANSVNNNQRTNIEPLRANNREENPRQNLTVFGTYQTPQSRPYVQTAPLFGSQAGTSTATTSQNTLRNQNRRQEVSPLRNTAPNHSRQQQREQFIPQNQDSDYEFFLNNRDLIKDLKNRARAANTRSRNNNQERTQRVVFANDLLNEPHAHSSDRTHVQRDDTNQNLILEFLKRQDLREERLESAKLPIVKSIGPDWLTFYEAFSKTHKYHSDYSNISRLQEAIKCDDILSMGGTNLFSPNEYLRTLIDINKRLGDPKKLSMKALQELLSMKAPRDVSDNSDTRTLINFINAVRNFANMQESYGNFSSQTDPHTIALIAHMLPRDINKKWYDKVLTIETNHMRVAKIQDLRDYLNSLIPSLERIQYSKDLINLKEIEKRPKSQNLPSKQGKMHNTNADKPAWQYKCWVCKSDSHLVKDCSKVRSLDGQEVIELAKSFHLCLECCREKYQGKCTSSRKPPPCPKCPRKSHWLTVCPNRKGNKSHQSHNSEQSNAENSSHALHNTSETTQLSNVANQQPSTSLNSNRDTSQNAVVNNQHQFFHEEGVERNLDLIWNFNNSHHNNMHHARKYMQSCNTAIPSVNTLRPKFHSASSILSVVVLKINNEAKAFLLDSGSTISLIDEAFANKLKIGGFSYPLTLYWSGSQKRVDNYSRIIQVKVTAITPEEKALTLHFHTFYQLGIGDQKFLADEIKSRYPYLNALNIVDYDKIVGVIGIDQAFAFTQTKKFLPPKNDTADSLIGIRGPLGDYVIGSSEPIEYIYRCLKANSSQHSKKDEISLPTYFHQSEMSELERMEEFLMGDDYYKINVTDRLDAEDAFALKILSENVRRSPNGINFEAPLLWKDEDPILPTQSSFLIAFKRLKIMTEHAVRKGKFSEIESQVASLLEKGYASEVSEHLLKYPSKKAFYIPIFFISPPGKRTRMIWDAKAEVEKGKSLNSFLLPGPNLYNEMLQILFRMREGIYLFKGDCKEMFHQIIIKEEDKDSLRFLFKFSNEPMKVFKMDRMVFGVVCSPSTSQFVVRKIASEYEISHPQAAVIIRDNLYVDDLVKSVNSIEEGQKLIVDARKILNSGGFELVKLNATNKSLFSLLNGQLTPEEKFESKIFSANDVEKLLGYEINFLHDILQISIAMPRIQKILSNSHRKPTKKEVLKVTLSLFDPLGLVMFLVSKFKLIYHWTCNEKLEWDDEIPNKLMNYWVKAIEYVPKLSQVAIPRCYSPKIAQSKFNQLWTFVDAGKDMMCAVTYVRFVDSNHQQIDYSIIGSKSFTVPSRQKRTIPELELDVVEKGINYIKNVIKAHSITFHELFVVTDSSCVFEWLTNGVTKPTIYVKNRLKKIADHKLPIKFLWVATNLQTADMGTKWHSMPEFSIKNEWFQPKLFSLPQNSWPDFLPPQYIAKFNNTKFGKRPNSDYYGSFFDSRKHSSFSKAINKAKKLLLRWKIIIQKKRLENDIRNVTKEYEKKSISERKFKKELQKLNSSKDKLLNDYEDVNYSREKIEILFFKDAQEEHFAIEIALLKSGKELPKTSKLYKVSPFLDKNELLRATTRLSDTQENRKKFSLATINPIILPAEHNVTKLVIMQAHASNRHVHNNSVIANLMRKFFIPHIKWTVNKTIKDNCYSCKLKSCKPIIPKMGDLPAMRLDAYAPIFKNTILDVCGPFKVIVGRSQAKRWLLVASCLTTRAVHIEILHHLTANSAILALNNLIHIRGKPDIIYSDMGTNFVGGYKELILCFNEQNKKLIEQGMEPLNITWINSPAKASHMNGCVERLIGLTKNALKKMEQMMSKKLYHLDDESFRAFICETIGILNNRPLCMIPIKDSSNEFLTPNNFLMLRPNFVSRTIDSNPRLITKYWSDVQKLANILWEHWLKAYLPTIMYREKWIDKSSPLQVGDLVITADPTVYNSWRLGKIVEIESGSQQQVRKVKVELGKNNTLKVELGKNNLSSTDKIIKTRKLILKAYMSEKSTVVTRPATAVAAINLRSEV